MPDPVVVTTNGSLRGARLASGCLAFKGVRYAAPPIGRLRFRPPEPVQAWDGVREAISFGASCTQPVFDEALGAPERSEDCLFLNVWTPSVDGARRPVMVWFHGGGYAFGSGSQPLYDGAALATRGDVIVVTVNHRLGPLGYLYLGELSDDPDLAASGSAGNLDLIAALGWVQREVGAFGGDPDDVMVFGESGGGAKICNLLAMPSAGGLFHRAAIQSGPLLRARSARGGTVTAEKVLAELGLDHRSVDRLWDVPVDDLVAASWRFSPRRDGRGLVPAVDGAVLPKHPVEAIGEGSAHDVPVIVGSNRDEGAGGLPPVLDDEGLRTWLARPFGVDNVDVIERTYREAHPAASNVDIYSFALSDSGMRAGSIVLAELKSKASSTPVYEYFFTYELGGRAGHGYEIAFVFDNLGTGSVSEHRRRLAEEMSEAWLAFARTGDPNHDRLEHWPPFTIPARSTMIFRRGGSAAVDDPSASTRELWSRIKIPARRHR